MMSGIVTCFDGWIFEMPLHMVVTNVDGKRWTWGTVCSPFRWHQEAQRWPEGRFKARKPVLQRILRPYIMTNCVTVLVRSDADLLVWQLRKRRGKEGLGWAPVQRK